MISDIERELGVLIGMPLWDATLAADMLMLQIGPPVAAPVAYDPARITGTYALHLQCPWRVSGEHGTIVGSRDIYVPADPDVDEDDFEWERREPSFAHVRLDYWIAKGNAISMTVIGVTGHVSGGFVLSLSTAETLEVLPCVSDLGGREVEQWRLLQPALETPHFVITNIGTG